MPTSTQYDKKIMSATGHGHAKFYDSKNVSLRGFHILLFGNKKSDIVCIIKHLYIISRYYLFLNCQKQIIGKTNLFTTCSKLEYHVALDRAVFYVVYSRVCLMSGSRLTILPYCSIIHLMVPYGPQRRCLISFWARPYWHHCTANTEN